MPHSDQKTREYLELARRLDLGVCGGSDFHGAVKPGIRLGVGKGRLKVRMVLTAEGTPLDHVVEGEIDLG